MTTTKMDPEKKARWVAALRSGKYKQGRHLLRSRTGRRMCCLGVLCDIATADGVGEWKWSQLAKEWEHRESPDGAGDAQLPLPAVRAWAGLPEGNPKVCHAHVFSTLSRVNDQGATFAEIADIIEEQL